MYAEKIYGNRFYNFIVRPNYNVHKDYSRYPRATLCACGKAIRAGKVLLVTGKRIKRIGRSKYNIRK